MFPLGSVLLPSAFLPLHLFEPRYLQLAEDCLAGDREFGVVLIARGSEVGGGDTRESVGTVAQILEAVTFDDGRWAIGAIGTRRIRVVAWRPDDPYPQAEVEDWPDEAAGADLAAVAHDVTSRLRRVLALRAELGEPGAPATQELSDDLVTASFQAVAVSPFGPADRQRLLEVPGAGERWSALDALLVDEEQVLVQRMSLDDGPSATDDFPFD
jgi:Lon protease-like protein